VSKSVSLEMVIGYFGYEFGPQGLPAEILSAAPAALGSWYALLGIVGDRHPRMVVRGALLQGREGICKLAPSVDAEP
jgi:hypothetical protein